ncbi:amino acid deaminase [Vibrio scophthalmi]|uniref:amino acid deaminase n=1 Tax=Vibrio scophthalmi TaxID=45658 RepID=UPI002FEE6789
MKMLDTDDNNYHNAFYTTPSYGEKAQPLPGSAHTRYRLTDDEVSLPAAVLVASNLGNNLDWMQRFANANGVKLCPHGKTSMTPALFRQQLEHGAWGLTVASAAQAEIAALAGAKEILIANQVVGKVNMAILAALINKDQHTVTVCVDSLANARALSHFFQTHQLTLNVLIEFGVEGGRCGCRTADEVRALAKAIHALERLNLRGIEVYEGVIHGDDAEHKIRQFLTQTVALARELKQNGWVSGQPMVTGAGSAWYDVVSETLAHLDDIDAVIRPGCYAIHDTGIYLDAQSKVMQRAQANQGVACELGGDLQSSLEVWAHVISRPEPTKIVAGLGKRDVAFDAGLPIADRAYRDGKALELGQAVTTAVMDQHAFIEVSADSVLEVGDILAFSTSHPCLTIDKWRALAICDDEYQVTHWVETRF